MGSTKVESSRSTKRDSFWSLFFRSTSMSPPDLPEASSTKVFWPRDYLACDIEEARIWTYGYNADALKGLFEASNQNGVSQHASDLAVRLERDIDNEVSPKYWVMLVPARDGLGCTCTDSRIRQDPILFVAHSLGGIILKDVGDVEYSACCRGTYRGS